MIFLLFDLLLFPHVLLNFQDVNIGKFTSVENLRTFVNLNQILLRRLMRILLDKLVCKILTLPI